MVQSRDGIPAPRKPTGYATGGVLEGTSPAILGPSEQTLTREQLARLPQAGTPTNPNGAGTLLKKAASIVEGSRQQTHGDKERSFKAAARMWDAYLSSRRYGGRSAPIRDKDVAYMMGLLKGVRSEYGNPEEPDHYVDLCGYNGLFGELAMARGAEERSEECEDEGCPHYGTPHGHST